MTEHRPHDPKLRALEAYRARRLSASAQARVERHLAGCQVCRASLVGMERYQSLMEAALEAAPPEIEWARMELPLQREVARRARLRRLLQLAGFGVVAAAACIALFARHGLAPAPTTPVATAPRAAEPEVARLHVEITAIVGAAQGVDASGTRVSLDLSSSPAEGWVLETGPKSELHIALEQTAAVLVPADSSLTLRSLREGRVVLDLARGSVVSHVRKLVGGEGYEVVAAAHRISVRGTRFSVERLSPGLAVQVDEGVVAVLHEDGQLITELRAPYRWTEGLNGLASAPAAHPQQLRKPREISAASWNWPAIEVPTWPHVVDWEIDGASFGASGLLQMRVPAGDLDVLAFTDDGRRMMARFHVDPLGAKFDPRALRWLNVKRNMDGTRDASRVDPRNAAAVIHDDEGALQRCYERAMRGQAAVSSGSIRMRLRLDLDADGRVRRVALADQNKDTVPAILNDCVRQVAQRWRFEAPGGRGVTFEAPLSFRAAR